MTYQTIQPFITPTSVIAVIPEARITGVLSLKIAQYCDGRRNLRDVAQCVHLPWLVCVKLVERAMARQWLRLSCAEDQAETIPVHFWAELTESLSTLQDAEPLMEIASRMLGHTPEQLPANQLCNYLIALELVTPDPQRPELIPIDLLRKSGCKLRGWKKAV